ncbi:hypothetical protein M5J15_02570 [Serratia symbiotica]|uniref:hypothetical protein n=1 Tax=Serratia symbiotica TaxID=138074 RepID=UPI002090549F|nr:hypothetical protein [Serratia symbiotica]USS96876.1 hypothetical protein M5J15_02570 [Serratia symbiotica]
MDIPSCRASTPVYLSALGSSITGADIGQQTTVRCPESMTIHQTMCQEIERCRSAMPPSDGLLFLASCYEIHIRFVQQKETSKLNIIWFTEELTITGLLLRV